MSVRVLPTARAFTPLLQPARYKGAFGGRGSGKSHFFAELLVEEAIMWPGVFAEPLYAVCIREVQKTLAQSAKRTIEIKIDKMRANYLFDVQNDRIKTPGGGLVIFQGMQNHTADSIKSLEGYSIAWNEEAQTTSARSLQLLRPTIRKKNRTRSGEIRDSQLWFSWNPRFATDPVDALLRGNDPNEPTWTAPPNSIVVEANWDANPWFHDTALVDEKEYDRRRDPDMYAHVWAGEYERNSEARVFRNWRVDHFDPPKQGTILYAGSDWGFSRDPTVLVVLFVVGRTIYVWREVWAIGCQIDRTPALFDQVDPSWTPEKARDVKWKSFARRLPIIADSARPETIDYMQRAGFPNMKAAIKGPGSVEDGVEFLKSYDIVVHPDCVHVIKELEHYSFKIDPHTGEVTSILEDRKNHTIDSLRYALENVRRRTTSSREELRF